jgi:hypothetical protein
MNIGKTQLCMTCASTTLLASAGARSNVVKDIVIYFDTELKFSIPRLADVLHTRTSIDIGEDLETQSALERFSLRRPETCRDLLAQIQSIPNEMMHSNISMVRFFLRVLLSSLISVIVS